MPEKLSHHFRQQVRWMRGAFIRSLWRFKYLRRSGYAYWSHLIGWYQLVLSSAVFIYLFIYMPAVDHRILPWLLLIPILIGYAQGLRYMTVWRSDESNWYRFCTYLCQPIPALWSFFVLRFVRYYAIVTCFKTGWGTRGTVEVKS
jgi:hyaluronan synthase